MSKNNNSIAILEQFTVGGNLDVNDILSVVTSKAEERYLQEIETISNKIKVVEEENAKKLKEINKQAQEEAVAPHLKAVKELQKALKPFGSEATIQAFTPYSRSNTVLPVNEKGELEARMIIEHKCWTLTAKPSKDLEAKAKAYEAGVEKVKQLTVEAIGWKRKLANIGMLERQYKAKIATAKLKGSSDGQKLLKLLSEDLEEAILSLPSC